MRYKFVGIPQGLSPIFRLSPAQGKTESLFSINLFVLIWIPEKVRATQVVIVLKL